MDRRVLGAAAIGAAIGVYIVIKRSISNEKETISAATPFSYAPTAADRARWAARLAEASVEESRPPGAAGKTAELWSFYAKLRDLLMAASPGDASMYGDHRFGHLLPATWTPPPPPPPHRLEPTSVGSSAVSPQAFRASKQPGRAGSAALGAAPPPCAAPAASAAPAVPVAPAALPPVATPSDGSPQAPALPPSLTSL